jgi:hypothetical protein
MPPDEIRRYDGTPVSTKRTNRVASKNHTSGRDKKLFLSDLISRGLRGKHSEKSDPNSKKIFLVLAGLIVECNFAYYVCIILYGSRGF